LSTNGYITYITLLFWMNSSITRYLIKNLSTNGYITYITLLFWMNSSITQYLIKNLSTNGYITYNSPFLDEFITWYVIKKFVHQWLYNLYNSPCLDEFITWHLIKYPSTNGYITYNSPFLDEFIITRVPNQGFNQSFTSLTCLANPLYFHLTLPT